MDLLIVGFWVCVVCILAFIQWFRVPSTRGIPTREKSNHWLYGQLFYIISRLGERHHALWEVRKEAKAPTCCFRLPLQPLFVCITGPAEVEHVLKTNWKNYPKGDLLKQALHEMLGRGIFAVDGEAWRYQRKTASHMFSMRALKDGMMSTFQDHSTQMLARIARQTVDDRQVDMSDMFYRYTLESICKIAFGVELHCFEKDHIPFMKAFDNAQMALDKRFLLPPPAWKLMRLLNVGTEKSIHESMQILEVFGKEIIAERRKMDTSKLHTNTDLLSMFLALDKDENGDKFTDKYLQDIMMNFIIAGRDTTAQALSWLFYELSKAPEVEKELVEELTRFETIDYKTVNALAYTDAVIRETLRLHPSVPLEFKQAKAADVLPDGTKIKKGDILVPMFWQMGRVESVWGKDCLDFKPSRFFDLDKEPSPFKFVAFQAGARICLGKRMAMLEMKVALHALLSKYKFTLRPDQEITYSDAITLPMKNPLLFKVTKRVNTF